MDMVFKNHEHGGDAGMGGKHDYAHNMGHPLDPLDHFPLNGPEDRNKRLDKQMEEAKKKEEEEKKKKEDE